MLIILITRVQEPKAVMIDMIMAEMAKAEISLPYARAVLVSGIWYLVP